jgi:diguanylate cyclase (GGDEF)-like protein
MISRESALEALLELTASSEPVTRPGLLRRVLRAALLLVQADGAVALAPHQGRIERYAETTDQRDLPAPEPPRRSPFMRQMMHGGRPVRVADLVLDRRLDEAEGCPGVDAGPALYAPMRRREHVAGTLAAFRQRGAAPFTSADARQLTLLAAWTALSLDNLRLSESVEKLAITDDLTQVYNYRFLRLALRRELKRAARFGQELSLVMLDVDHLKSYNDRHGHLRGSYLLREMAALLAGQVRSFDLIAKYGGDEFTLILPQTGLEGAVVVAERMRRAVAEHAFPLVTAGEITISSGVATFPADAVDGPSLVRTADAALYVAKNRGRNLVLTHRGVAEQAGTPR